MRERLGRRIEKLQHQLTGAVSERIPSLRRIIVSEFEGLQRPNRLQNATGKGIKVRGIKNGDLAGQRGRPGCCIRPGHTERVQTRLGKNGRAPGNQRLRHVHSLRRRKRPTKLQCRPLRIKTRPRLQRQRLAQPDLPRSRIRTQPHHRRGIPRLGVRVHQGSTHRPPRGIKHAQSEGI